MSIKEGSAPENRRLSLNSKLSLPNHHTFKFQNPEHHLRLFGVLRWGLWTWRASLRQLDVLDRDGLLHSGQHTELVNRSERRKIGSVLESFSQTRILRNVLFQVIKHKVGRL